ncbi:hypothetical protein [Mycoplasma miroungirhinis]|nr:hypothetical protein [Mycoplasma miroungirhinis]
MIFKHLNSLTSRKFKEPFVLPSKTDGTSNGKILQWNDNIKKAFF